MQARGDTHIFGGVGDAGPWGHTHFLQARGDTHIFGGVCLPHGKGLCPRQFVWKSNQHACLSSQQSFGQLYLRVSPRFVPTVHQSPAKTILLKYLNCQLVWILCVTFSNPEQLRTIVLQWGKNVLAKGRSSRFAHAQ